MTRHISLRIATIGLCILAWEILARVLDLPEYLVPKPLAILTVLWEKGSFFSWHAVSTVTAALLGLGFALMLGASASLVFVRFERVAAVGEPVLGAAQTVPILALAPILTAWLGPGLAAKAAAAALVSLPSVATTLFGGLSAVSSDEIDLFKSMRATPWKLIWFLRIPRALPYLFVAMRVAVPLALLGAVVGEFVGAERGLGVVILRASYYLRTTEMVAAVVVVSFLSVALVGSVAALKRRIGWLE